MAAEKSWGVVRSRARLVAATLAANLGSQIPGRVAKYDDAFNPRAFGNLVQTWGTSTVPDLYERLPFNTGGAYDVLVRGGMLVLPGMPPLRADVAINYDDAVARTGGRVREVGDLAAAASAVLRFAARLLHCCLSTFSTGWQMRSSDGLYRSLVAGAAAFLLVSGCNTDTSKVRAAADSAAADSAAAVAAAAAVTTVPQDTTRVLSPLDSAALRAQGDSTATAGPPVAGVRLEVDITARKVMLYRGTELLATHPVAVGSTEWPTRTGEWNVTQVVWNPEWIPPDESWAEERKPRKPGDPKNPLGQAQLVYDPPRSIHGTNDSASVGKAVSHGSIRAHNSVVKELARRLMEETGVGKDSLWYRDTQKNRTVKQVIDLPHPVPIRVF